MGDAPPKAGTLTIAMLGWARLPMGAAEGGGLNQVVTQLAGALVDAGHRVLYLRSGLDYSLRRGTRIVREGDWRGVECYDVVNSHNLSIGSANFENVPEQIASPTDARLVAEFLKREGVDVLHVHSFEGVSFDLVATVKREAGIAVVVTPHNYIALCPQVDLLHQERRVCDDYEGGLRCVGCLKAPEFSWEMRRRARVQTVRRLTGSKLYDAIKAWARLAVRAMPRGSGRRAFEAPAPDGTPLAEPVEPGRGLAHERLLTNRDRHLVVLNEYGQRRKAGVAALNEADLVLPPGRFLARVHEAMGVDPRKMRLVPLGLRHIDELRTAARRSESFEAPAWTPASQRPLRLAFFGSCWANKGLTVLVEALVALGGSSRLEVEIHASGDDRTFRQRLGAMDHVRFCGAFTGEKQARALEWTDVGVFPGLALENSPLVILEMLAAGRFVIASRRGAMEEFVTHGSSGLLFHPGDPGALAGAIASVVRGEVALPTRRAVQESSHPRSFEHYVDEMQRVLREVTSKPAPQRTPDDAAAFTSLEIRR
jgi:glycosyltransferase involved in cell wall biosynthesis